LGPCIRDDAALTVRGANGNSVNNLRNFNNVRNIRSPDVARLHDTFMMPALFDRKANDADASAKSPYLR
jgi:hypothetical protein